jgi:hypothetical protein
MVDDEARVGMAVDQRGARVQVAPAQNVDGKIVANGGTQDPVEARVVRLAVRLLGEDDTDATVPGVFFQSATTSAAAGSSGSTGLTMARRSGWARCTSTA